MAITKKDLNKEYIRAYCRENAERTAWYNSFMTTPIEYTAEDGTTATRKPTFIELQLAFIKQYFPELAPKPKRAKKESIYDLL